MRGFNKATIMGNVVRDLELRYTVNKKAYTRFTVAVNRKWKDQNGELKDSTAFIPVTVWGPMAETCGKYLKKGSGVLVEGRIETGSYDAKDGSGKRYTTEIYANEVHFVGGKPDEGGNEPPREYGRSAPSSNSSSSSAKPRSVRDSGFNDDDFPTDISEIDLGEGDEADIPF